MRTRRVFSALAAFGIIFILLSASLFLTVHAGHVCHAERCPVCLGLQSCVERFNAPALTGRPSGAFAEPPRPVRTESALFLSRAQCLRTLVSWKVKLSN